MASLRLASYASLLAALPYALAGYSNTSSSNVAVYWGQNSFDQSSGPLEQQNLAYYCANSNIDIIPLAFMDGISPAMTNFANAGNNCTAFPDNAQLLNCPQIEADIKTCQSTYGKTITISLGGATYTQGGWTSTSAAQAAATSVWEMFGPVTGSSVDRPFGSAVIDGFDFDFESTMNNLESFASTLRGLMDSAMSGGSKTFILTAAPQCVYPDAADSSALQGEVFFDYVQVQFYNNFCGVDNFQPGASTQNDFNFATWDNWAHTVSKNPDVKVLLGIPANTGAGGGYVSGTQLQDVIEYCKSFSSFGGVMMWDMSQLYANTGFLSQVASDLGQAAPPPPKTSTAAGPTKTTTAAGGAPTNTGTGSTGSGTVGQWDQCGGQGYTGPTKCEAPYSCVTESTWWASCQ